MAGEYNKLRVIGSGSFGTVWLVANRETAKHYVIKEVNVSGLAKQLRAKTLTEVETLGRCRHLNVIRYRDAFVHAGALNIVMEYAEGGDLHKRIKDQNGTPFKEEGILDWFVQICFALRYIHGLKILHRDLKSQNIFLKSDSHSLLKVGDFGIARILHDTNDHAMTAIGTPYYLSPEICQQLPYDYKSDMWAAGCILYELCCLRYPFDGTDLGALVVAIMRGRYEAIPSNYGQLLIDLVSVLLRVQPERRPTAEQILGIPIMQSYVNKYVGRTSSIREQNTPSPKVRIKRNRDKTPDSPNRDKANVESPGHSSPSRGKRARCQSWVTPRASRLIDCSKPPNSADAGPKRIKKTPCRNVAPNTELFRKIIQKKLDQLKMAKDKDEFYDHEVSESAPDPSKRSMMKDHNDNTAQCVDIILTPPNTLAYNGETYYIAPPSPVRHHKDRRSPMGRDHHVVVDKHRADLDELSIASEERCLQTEGDVTRGEGNAKCELLDICRQLYDSCPRSPSDAFSNMHRLSCVLRKRLGMAPFLDYYTVVKDALVLGDSFDALMESRKDDDDFDRCLPLVLQLVQLESISRAFTAHATE